MSNQNSELDSLAEILWCEKIKRDGGSIAYVMSVGDGRKVVMTHRLERLQQLIKNRESALLSRIKKEAPRQSRKAQDAYLVDSNDFTAVVKERAFNKAVRQFNKAIDTIKAEIERGTI